MRDQAAFIRLRWPEFECSVRRGKLICTGPMQPSPSHHRYQIRVSYAASDIPKVIVLSPVLVPREPGGTIEHTYPDGSICPFHPREWRPDRLLAMTVLPWTCRWLHVYEVWLVTGDWDADGVHPPKQVSQPPPHGHDA